MISKSFGAACAGLMAVCAGSAIGCAVEAGGGPLEGSVESRQQEAAVWTEATLWPNNIEVCFRNNGGYCRNRCTTSGRECGTDANCDEGETCRTNQTRCENNTTICSLDSQCDVNPVASATYEDAKELVEDALIEAWQDPSGLTFDFSNGDCGPSPPTPWLVINLTNAGWPGACRMGAGNDCALGILDRGWIQGVVVHEVGHALGLPHEQQRLDAEVCAWLSAQLEGCEDCWTGTCTEAHFEACFGGDVTGTQEPTGAQLFHVFKVLWDSAPDSRAAALTSFDSYSVMNYCRDSPVPTTDPALSAWRPTALDALAIEILYPKSGALTLGCDYGCVPTSAGVIVRSDGYLADEWTHRGAVPWWAASPTWKKGTTTVATSDSLSAALLGSGGTVTMTATNKWNDVVVTATGTATVSNSTWTAITMAAL